MPNSISKAIRIVAFGELLWDMLPTGKKLGGAPVNFLYHAQTLGALTQPLTCVGNDSLGAEIVQSLRKLGVATDFIQISPTRPTGTVKVSLDEKGIPSYEIVENVAWDSIQVDDQVIDNVVSFLSSGDKKAFYFGSLALRGQENREALRKLLEALPSSVLRICDLNLRPPFTSFDILESILRETDLFKLNDGEAIQLDRLFAKDGEPSLAPLADAEGGLGKAIDQKKSQTDQIVHRWAEDWSRRFVLRSVILTCGAHGAYLYQDGRLDYAPSVPVEVKDSVGAGDSFAAVCVCGLLNSIPGDIILEQASKRAAFVCAQEGATPAIPPQYSHPFDN